MVYCQPGQPVGTWVPAGPTYLQAGNVSAGAPVYFNSTEDFAAGRYRLAYATGSFRFNTESGWVVSSAWRLVRQNMDLSVTTLLTPPSVAIPGPASSPNGIYPNGGWDDALLAALANAAAAPIEFTHTGGPLGLVMHNMDYLAHIPGDPTPTWSLVLIEQCVLPPQAFPNAAANCGVNLQAIEAPPIIKNCNVPQAPAAIPDCSALNLDIPTPIDIVPCPTIQASATTSTIMEGTPTVNVSVINTSIINSCGDSVCNFQLQFGFQFPAGLQGPRGFQGPRGGTGPQGPPGGGGGGTNCCPCITVTLSNGQIIQLWQSPLDAGIQYTSLDGSNTLDKTLGYWRLSGGSSGPWDTASQAPCPPLIAGDYMSEGAQTVTNVECGCQSYTCCNNITITLASQVTGGGGRVYAAGSTIIIWQTGPLTWADSNGDFTIYIYEGTWTMNAGIAGTYSTSDDGPCPPLTLGDYRGADTIASISCGGNGLPPCPSDNNMYILGIQKCQMVWLATQGCQLQAETDGGIYHDPLLGVTRLVELQNAQSG